MFTSLSALLLLSLSLSHIKYRSITMFTIGMYFRIMQFSDIRKDRSYRQINIEVNNSNQSRLVLYSEFGKQQIDWTIIDHPGRDPWWSCIISSLPTNQKEWPFKVVVSYVVSQYHLTFHYQCHQQARKVSDVFVCQGIRIYLFFYDFSIGLCDCSYSAVFSLFYQKVGSFKVLINHVISQYNLTFLFQ